MKELQNEYSNARKDKLQPKWKLDRKNACMYYVDKNNAEHCAEREISNRARRSKQ